MSGLIICSKQSNLPYYIKDIDINIYSIEELSYYLYNHVYLVDEDFFSESLINYIENVLDQKLIANGIRQAKTHKGGLVELISFVVKAASYYSERELAKLQKELDLLGNKSGIERLKAKGDILLSCKKYRNAFECYKYILLKKRDQNLSSEFYGNIYNNLGIICANMFKYKDAGNYFRQGYKLSRSLVVLKHLILTNMLADNQAELEKDILQFKVSDEMMEECRGRIENAKADSEDWLNLDSDEIEMMIHEYRSDN